MGEEPNNGTGFTQKEMLVRVDGKLDVVIAKQQNYDVEMALLKARVEQAEHKLAEDGTTGEKWKEEFRGELATIRDEQSGISSRQKATAIIVAAVVIVANLAAPIVLRHL